VHHRDTDKFAERTRSTAPTPKYKLICYKHFRKIKKIFVAADFTLREN